MQKVFISYVLLPLTNGMFSQEAVNGHDFVNENLVMQQSFERFEFCLLIIHAIMKNIIIFYFTMHCCFKNTNNITYSLQRKLLSYHSM